MEQQKHFIKDIEIKNFKCFKDFRAEGFGRVNLIGGKNNVGKTAFMEALYINTNGENKIWFLNSIFQITRGRDNFFVQNNKDNLIGLMFAHNSNLAKNYNSINSINTNIVKTNFSFIEKFTGTQIRYYIDKKEYIENISLGDIKDSLLLKNEFTTHSNSHLLRTMGLNNFYINRYYVNIQKIKKEDRLNKALKIFDNDINDFKIMDKEPKVDSIKFNDYISITQLGDGLKQFINIFILLFTSKDGYLFIDEMDNGIHYNKLDLLWEIILTISKEQNVQVFATTHSKEAIESYSRVAKKLEDKDVAFIELGKNKKDEIRAMVYPYEWFIDEIEQNHEVRGW